MNSLTITVLAVLTLAALGGFIAITRLQRPVLALPAGLALAIALSAAVFFGSQLANASTVTIFDYPPASFQTWYDDNRLLYGPPISKMTSESGVLVVYHTTVRQEYHPEIPDPTWRHQLGNIGTEWFELNNISPDPNPVTPDIVTAYLAGKIAKGVDLGRVLGAQISYPRNENGTTVVYFQKGALAYKEESNDPASITRLPLGQMVWEVKNGRNPENPWTPARQILVVIAGILAAIPLVAWFVPGLRGEGSFD